jgi:hypothetical protein
MKLPAAIRDWWMLRPRDGVCELCGYPSRVALDLDYQGYICVNRAICENRLEKLRDHYALVRDEAEQWEDD